MHTLNPSIRDYMSYDISEKTVYYDEFSSKIYSKENL